MSHIYIYIISSLRVNDLTFILLTWRKWTPNNASKCQMGFNSAFKGLNSGRNKVYFTWGPIYIFFVMFCWFFRRMTNISDKSCTEYQPHILCSITPFFENLSVYEIILKNTIEPHTPQMKIWPMRIACWLPKSTNTHLECVKHIALPLLRWLHERAPLLRSTYIACLFIL